MPVRALELTLLLAPVIAGLSPGRAEAETSSRIPAPLTGVWAWSAQDCTGANADGRVRVGSRSIGFNASNFEFEDVVIRGDDTLRAAAIVSEEGETTTSRHTIELRLVASDRLSIRIDAGNEVTVYVRCASP